MSCTPLDNLLWQALPPSGTFSSLLKMESMATIGVPRLSTGVCVKRTFLEQAVLASETGFFNGLNQYNRLGDT